MYLCIYPLRSTTAWPRGWERGSAGARIPSGALIFYCTVTENGGCAALSAALKTLYPSVIYCAGASRVESRRGKAPHHTTPHHGVAHHTGTDPREQPFVMLSSGGQDASSKKEEKKEWERERVQRGEKKRGKTGTRWLLVVAVLHFNSYVGRCDCNSECLSVTSAVRRLHHGKTKWCNYSASCRGTWSSRRWIFEYGSGAASVESGVFTTCICLLQRRVAPFVLHRDLSLIAIFTHS